MSSFVNISVTRDGKQVATATAYGTKIAFTCANPLCVEQFLFVYAGLIGGEYICAGCGVHYRLLAADDGTSVKEIQMTGLPPAGEEPKAAASPLSDPLAGIIDEPPLTPMS